MKYYPCKSTGKGPLETCACLFQTQLYVPFPFADFKSANCNKPKLEYNSYEFCESFQQIVEPENGLGDWGKKKRHKLKIVSYILFGGQNWGPKPKTQHLRYLWGTAQKRQGQARIHRNFCNKDQIVKMWNLALFYVWGNARFSVHWNHSFDIHLSYPLRAHRQGRLRWLMALTSFVTDLEGSVFSSQVPQHK